MIGLISTLTTVLLVLAITGLNATELTRRSEPNIGEDLGGIKSKVSDYRGPGTKEPEQRTGIDE
jgi:hypothetical protein